MNENGRKIVVVGTGFVGATISYSLIARNLVNDLVLIDINDQKAHGEAVDISHAAPVFGSAKVRAGEYKDVKDSDIIIITAGVNRKPGETRLDLASKNVGIMKSIVEEIMKYYNGGLFIIVSNPVDVITTMVQKWTGLPAEKIIGSGTSLDTVRLRQTLYEMYNVDVKNIHASVIGEHGETQFPYWSGVAIGSVPLKKYPKTDGTYITDEEMERIAQDVTKSGAYIIKNKGATYFGVASAVSEIVDAICGCRNKIIPVSMVKDELYGMKNVALSVPRIIGRSGIVADVPITLTAEEEEKMKKSAENVYSIVKEFIK